MTIGISFIDILNIFGIGIFIGFGLTILAVLYIANKGNNKKKGKDINARQI